MPSSTYVPSTHLSNLNIYYLLTIYVSIYLAVYLLLNYLYICLLSNYLSIYYKQGLAVPGGG